MSVPSSASALEPAPVVVTHTQQFVRDAVGALLERSGRVRIAGSVAPTFLEQSVSAAQPCVVLIALDGDADRDATALRVVPYLPASTRTVIVAHGHPLERHVVAGLPGCVVVPADRPGDEIVNAVIERAGDLGLPAPSAGAHALKEDVRWTAHERMLIALVARGCTCGEIADRMGMEREEARDRLLELLDSLGLSDRTQLAAYALEAGLTDVTGASEWA